MFRAIISPIIRSTRLCVTACSIMHLQCCRQAALLVHYTTSCNTQSSAPEDGRNYRPKHVELIGIINKPLLLHLVGCLYYVIYQLEPSIEQIGCSWGYALVEYRLEASLPTGDFLVSWSRSLPAPFRFYLSQFMYISNSMLCDLLKWKGVVKLPEKVSSFISPVT